LSQRESLPSVIVGDSAGIRMLMDIIGPSPGIKNQIKKIS
jgi:hypothetical protein